MNDRERSALPAVLALLVGFGAHVAWWRLPLDDIELWVGKGALFLCVLVQLSALATSIYFVRRLPTWGKVTTWPFILSLTLAVLWMLTFLGEAWP